MLYPRQARRRRSFCAAIERLESRYLLAAGTGLKADLFDYADLTAWKLARTDGAVNFSWGTASPDAAVGASTYSVRWAGQVLAQQNEAYTFHVTSDDGVRLWVDGQRLIDGWVSSDTVTTRAATIDLIGGRRYDIALEYFHDTGTSAVKLEWSSPSQSRQVIPSEWLFPAKTGGLLREVWTGISGSTVADLTGNAAYPNSPTLTTLYAPAESPTSWADSFGERLRGYVTAPVTGDYTFYIASDDFSSLLLSNSSDPAGARQIASVSGYTASRQWTKFASQKSVTIGLVANQAYYIEALHKDGASGDNLAIGWTVPGGSTIEVIPSYSLSPLLPTVKVYQIQPKLNEGSEGGSRLQVAREGAITGNDLVVSYVVSGSATAGADYAALSGTVTIPAGARTAEVLVSPVQDALLEGDETVTITLLDGPQYMLGNISSQSGTAVIQDDEFGAPNAGVSAVAADPLAAFTSYGAGTTRRIVNVTGPGITRALELSVTGTFTNYWDTQAQLRNTLAMNQGDVLMVQFVARAVSGTGELSVVYQRATTPYTNSLNQRITFGSQWTKFQFPFSLVESYAANSVNLNLQIGYRVQTIQIANVQVTSYGTAAMMLPENTFGKWSLYNNAYGAMRVASVSGPTFTEALEVETTVVPANYYSLQTLQPTIRGINVGDTVYMEYYARSVATPTATISAFMQKAGTPYTKSGFSQRTIGTEWTLVRMPFTSAETYAAGAAQIGFFYGYGLQTVQIGGLRVVAVPAAASTLAADPLAAFGGADAAYGTSQVVTATGAPTGFTQALQIATTTVPGTASSFAVSQASTAAMVQGDSIYLEFYARSLSGTAQFDAIVRSAAAPTVTSLSSRQSVGTTWTLVRLSFTLAGTYAAGGVVLALACGYGPQTLQIGQVRMIDANQAFSIGLFPRIDPAPSYGGRDATSSWRDTAQAGIAANRMAPVTVNVVDQLGRPVDGAQVIIRQKKHAYTFGVALSGATILAKTADAERYRQTALRYYNSIVLANDLKWQWWLSDNQIAVDAANWVVNQGVMLRGHNLIWPSRRNMPSSIWSTYDTKYATDPAEAAAWLRQAVLDHMADEAGRMAGIVSQWDVVNEPWDNHEVMDILGNSAMIDWFNAAHAADPNAQLYLNDYTIFTTSSNHDAHRDNFDGWISYLLANGAALHAIGEQSHFGAAPPDIDRLQPVIDRFARFGLPILVTEFDQDTADEQTQADFLRDYFTLIFSQPLSNGIVQWSFWEGTGYRPYGALFRSNWSAKPNGQQYIDLIYNDWWSDLRGTTLGGAFIGRVFEGDYEIVVQKNDTQIVQTVVGDGGGTITVTLDTAGPTVGGITINGGQGQRSMVTQVGVSFAEEVTLGMGAVTVRLANGNVVPNTAVAVANPSGDGKTYLLSFSGSGVVGGSLADGVYDVVVTASGVKDLAGNAMGGDYTQRFHRLFGDTNGDRKVNLIDYRSMRVTLGRAAGNPLFSSALDGDGNGQVSVLDLAQFRRRYGKVFVY